MSTHNHDDHIHTSLTELHECIAQQRERFVMQMFCVFAWSMAVIAMWILR